MFQEESLKEFYSLSYEELNEAFVKDYLEKVSNYIEYYHRKARMNRASYYITSGVRIIAVALIPFIQALPFGQDHAWAAASASCICVGMEAAIHLLKNKRKWINYREHCNQLMREYRQFYVKFQACEKTARKEIFEAFVHSVEGILEDEETTWKKATKKSKAMDTDYS